MSLRRHPDLLLCALLAACAPVTPRTVPAASVAPAPAVLATTSVVRLDPGDVQALAELLRMEDVRQFDATLSARHLAAATPELRARAALAAGRSGDRAATPLLLQALGDSVELVRARAAFALGELADSSAEVSAALARVALQDAGSAALEAAAALGRIGVETGRLALDSILSTTRHPAALRQEALLAAWRLPRNVETVRNIARWVTDSDAETRWRAAYALGRAPSPGGAASLLQVVNDVDARVRMNALRGLRAPIADSASVREPALNALRAAATDSHPHVRINALGLLPAYRTPAVTTPLLVAALDDRDANVAVAAAQALALNADAGAAAALRAATLPGRADGLRTAALAAWARVDSIGASALAREWADSARWLLRVHAARAFARTGWPAARDPLFRLARDGHYLVAAEALAALRAAADSLPDTRPIMIELLAAEHPLVRAAAARGLARVAGSGDLDVLLQAYGRARADSASDAALAAVFALARLRRLGVPVDRPFFLRYADPPRLPAVYRAVRDSIGEPPAAWPEPRAVIEPRPHEFYLDVIQRYVAHVLAGGTPPRAIIATAHGDIELELAAADAPLTVHNFITLVERGYYRDTRWHRVVPNFVIQDGDPRGDGSGGPGYAIRDEINPLRYTRGALGMALSGPHTGGSQFFITHSPQPHLDGGYTVFGRVRAGMDVVDRVVQEDPIHALRIIR